MLGQHPDVASIVPETIPDDRGGLITQDPARLGNYCRSVSCAVFYSIPFFVFALLLLSPSRNSDPGSHSRLFSPPPLQFVRSIFIAREDFSSFLPRRLASNSLLTHARRSQQLLVPFVSKSHLGGIRTHRPTLLILMVAFEGYIPLLIDHQGAVGFAQYVCILEVLLLYVLLTNWHAHTW